MRNELVLEQRTRQGRRVARTLGYRQSISDDLERLDRALTAVVSAVLQDSSRAAGTMIGVATSKLVAASVVAGTFGVIGAVGTASTGTAIASLSGAAATTATLFWIGSSIGLGVAAGSLMLTGTAIAAGVGAAIVVRRRILGRRRSETELSESERAALYAALRLAAPVRALKIAGKPITTVEVRIFALHGLMPLAAALENRTLQTRRSTRTRHAWLNQDLSPIGHSDAFCAPSTS